MPHIQRHFGDRLKQLFREFPAVVILGARQCGKTTFAKEVLPDWRYLDLEKPSDLAKIEDDPEGALHRWERHIILDEVQRLPSLFPILRGFIDEKRNETGRLLLLGSASFELIKGISETLAGRVGFLDMTPFHVQEVSNAPLLWFRGGFPNAYLARGSSAWQDWFEAYTRTFIERDLNQLGVGVSSSQTRRLMSMLAHNHGGLLNASELGGSLGVSYHTVNRYLDILEETFLVRRLKPYFANIGKRQVKSPKIYIRDSGLLHYLSGMEEPGNLEGHPKRGASWEGFVIEQVAGFVALHSPGTEIYFWKTSTGKEVDLLLKKGRNLLPFEIKLHTAPRKSDLKGLVTCLDEMNLKDGYVIRPKGETYTLGDGVQVIGLSELFKDFPFP